MRGRSPFSERYDHYPERIKGYAADLYLDRVTELERSIVVHAPADHAADRSVDERY
jgi:hypothetical protein